LRISEWDDDAGPSFRPACTRKADVSSKDRDFRPPRRRSFDDDNFEPPMRDFGSPPPSSGSRGDPMPSGPPVRAVVKWFKPDKGFGFVELAGGAGDAFLHASVLERSGISAVLPGATLEVRAGAGPKGQQVVEVLNVDSTTAVSAPRQPSFRPGPRQPSSEATVQVSGTVKWFNAAKGFGFIARDEGGKDVFVHASALERSGISGLNEGQRVFVEAVEGSKGVEAAQIRLA
jgi:CspA family cold shock protein